MNEATLGSFLGRVLQRHEVRLTGALLIVVLLAGIFDRAHLYWYYPAESAKEIIRYTSFLGIFALGSAIVIIAGGIDLSTGSMIALGGTTCASLMLLLDPEGMSGDRPVHFWVYGVAIGGALFVGFLVGSLHAWLITVVRLPPFIATLATLVGLRSLARALIERVQVAVIGSPSTRIEITDERFRVLKSFDDTYFPVPLVLLVVLSFLTWLLMSRTVTGRHLYAMGGNEQAARLSGIRTDQLKWLAYVLSAVLSALAGVLSICDQAAAEPQSLGLGYELNAIAAAVVGGCSLQGGVGTITGTVLGCLFLRTVIDGVARIIKTGAEVYEGLVVGIVVVCAVALTEFRRAGQSDRQFFPGMLGWFAALTLGIVAGLLATLVGQPRAGLTAGLAVTAVLFVLKFVQDRRASVTIPSGSAK